MNEYAIRTTGRSIVLQWFAESPGEAKREAVAAGHNVSSVRLVKEEVPPPCPGVVCRCDEPGIKTCP